MSNDMLKNLPKGLVDAVKLIIETTVPVQTRHVQQFDEELKGNQHKIDANKNGKIDAGDFKLLRRKKAVKEALESGVDASDIVQFHSPMHSDLHEEIAVVVHRDARDGTIHVMAEGMKYKLKKDQIKEVSSHLMPAKTNPGVSDKSGPTGGHELKPKKPKYGPSVYINPKKPYITTKTNEETDLTESTYEFDISGEHGNAAVDELVKHANSKGIKAKVHTYDGPGGGNPVIHLSHKDPKVVHAYAKKHIDPDVDLSDHKINEEVEQVDELSTKTLEKYKNAARTDAYDADTVDDDPRFRKRAKGITTATKKIRSNFVKGVDEAFEQVDELSIDTMNNYGRERARTVFSGGQKPGESVNAAINRKSKQGNMLSLARTKINRVRDTGSTVLNKEEVEELDELSKDTVQKYKKAAVKDYYDADDVDDGRRVGQRYKGIKMANRKLAKEEAEELEELSQDKLMQYRSAAKKQGTGIQDKMKIGGGDWSKDGKDTNTLKKRMAGYKMAGRKVNPGISASVGKAPRVAATEEVQIDELSKKTLAKYIPAAAKDAEKAGAHQEYFGHDQDFRTGRNRQKGIERAVKKLAKEELEIEEGMEFEFEDRGIATVVEITENRIILAFDEGIEEFDINDIQFEELDEVHNGYKADSEKSKFNSGHRAKLMNPEGKISYLSGKSYKTPAHAKDAAKFYGSIMHLPIQTMDSKMSQYNKAYDAKHGDVKEEVEIDEARGRPPKAPKEGQKPSPAWQRHLERQNKGEDKEELEALGAQLRKAVSINKPVTFLNGEKKEVAPHHIARFEDHMAARPRTVSTENEEGKLDFQNRAHASPDAFVKAVSEPIPKQSGGTSSIVKYR